jgi:1,4-alpha-glucan branching enzyme
VPETGYLLIAVHAHQPFVRHPEYARAFEENWLCEALAECYLPLVGVCQGLLRDGIDARLTFSLSPSLCAMLQDDHLQRRFIRYLEDRVDFLGQHAGRLPGDQARLARMFLERYAWCRAAYEGWHRDLVAAFRHLRESHLVSLITSAATHAYLPLWEPFDDFVRLQVETGAAYHQRCFGTRPAGMWLPECGFSPALEAPLEGSGIKYFFVAGHGILNAEPRPQYGEFAPVHTPRGLAAFGWDHGNRHQVWDPGTGYPGDPVYLDSHSDVGYQWDLEAVRRLTHFDTRIPTGIRFHRGPTGTLRELYVPGDAMARCEEHASHFVQYSRQRARELNRQLGRKPVMVALFDAELFGHNWNEGPVWLDRVIRKLASEQDEIRLVTPEEYLQLCPTNQVAMPSASSWGYQGYHETWLMGKNHWIYPVIYEAMHDFRILIGSVPDTSGPYRTALNQYLRELLLTQASDWAFNIWMDTTHDYARRRIEGHLDNMKLLRRQIAERSLDHEAVEALRQKNNIFGDMDLLRIYQTVRASRLPG